MGLQRMHFGGHSSAHNNGVYLELWDARRALGFVKMTISFEWRNNCLGTEESIIREASASMKDLPRPLSLFLTPTQPYPSGLDSDQRVFFFLFFSILMIQE